MVLSLITLIWVEDVFDASTSVQFTSVPFKTSLAGVISNFDTTGRVPFAEILEKVIMIDFTSKSDVAGKEFESKIRLYLLSPSETRMKLHSNNVPGTVHVNSSWSPLHTATSRGDITTPIIINMNWLAIGYNSFNLRHENYLLRIHDGAAGRSLALRKTVWLGADSCYFLLPESAY